MTLASAGPFASRLRVFDSQVFSVNDLPGIPKPLPTTTNGNVSLKPWRKRNITYKKCLFFGGICDRSKGRGTNVLQNGSKWKLQLTGPVFHSSCEWHLWELGDCDNRCSSTDEESEEFLEDFFGKSSNPTQLGREITAWSEIQAIFPMTACWIVQDPMLSKSSSASTPAVCVVVTMPNTRKMVPTQMQHVPQTKGANRKVMPLGCLQDLSQEVPNRIAKNVNLNFSQKKSVWISLGRLPKPPQRNPQSCL